MFKTFKVFDVQETALGANKLLSEVNRLKWKTTNHDRLENSKEHKYTKFDGNQFEELHLTTNRNFKCSGWDTRFEIILEPMQIRTFILNVESK